MPFAGIGFEADTHIVGDGLEESERKSELTALGHLRVGARILDILSETSHVGNPFQLPPTTVPTLPESRLRYLV